MFSVIAGKKPADEKNFLLKQELKWYKTQRFEKADSDGIYWWCVIPGENRKNISFSPLHLPAEEVIKKHFLNYANE